MSTCGLGDRDASVNMAFFLIFLFFVFILISDNNLHKLRRFIKAGSSELSPPQSTQHSDPGVGPAAE